MRTRPCLLTAVLAAGCAAARPVSPALDEARRHFEAGRYGEAVTRLNDAQLRKLRSREVPRGYELRGQSQARLGRIDEALRTFQTGAAQFPKDINLLTHLGNLLHQNALDTQARPFYERILKLSPFNAAAHLGLAETESKLGFFDRAAAHYEAALKTWGDQPGIWLDFAETLSRGRRDAEALEAAAQALALAETGEVRAVEARILWRLGRLGEAFASLGRAQDLEPARLDLLQQGALWNLEAGTPQTAEANARALLQRSPDDALGLWVRGSALLRLGKTDEARRELERAASRRDAPFIAATAAGMLKHLQ